MKQPLLIANWKMNLDVGETVKRIRACIRLLSAVQEKADIVICPSFIGLLRVQSLLKHHPQCSLSLGAQDCAWEKEGAYTGEVSPVHLEQIGCRYVLLGHSERRQFIRETDAMVAKKFSAVLSYSTLIPVVCVGETASERKKDKTEKIIRSQLQPILNQHPPSDHRRIVIAYEPVWAIGTGIPATPRDCARVSSFIRKFVKSNSLWRNHYPDFFILYGGSVKAENVHDFIANQNSDGALVGSASLDPQTFITLIKNASN